jgi:hypothetical protein
MVSGRPEATGLVVAFAGLGATAATIPAILPALQSDIDGDLLYAVPSLFGGLLVGVLASMPVLARLSPRSATALGAVIQFAALLVIAVAGTQTLVIAAAAIAGFGFGIAEASGSVAAKYAATGTAARTLGFLTGTVAVAAAAFPLLVASLPSGARLVPAIAAAVHLTAATLLVRRSAGAVAPEMPDAGRNQLDRARRIGVASLGIALALYVGVETIFSGWSAVIPGDLLSIDPRAAALGTSVFWSLMAAGRFLSAFLLAHWVEPRQALLVNCIVATAMLVVSSIAAANAPILTVSAIGVAIVALAPSYSLLVGSALDLVDSAATGRVTGLLVACGATGGAVVPAALLFANSAPASSRTLGVAALLCIAIPAIVQLGTGAVRREAGPTPGIESGTT